MYKQLFFLIASGLLLLTSCSHNKKSNKRNPYNLPLVVSVSDFNNQVSKNPEMALLNLEQLIKGVELDIRYATKNNFTNEIIYKAPKAYARKPVAEALKLVQDSLAFYDLGLKIFDAYRPYAATLRFYEVYPNTEFVADPQYGSRHNRGCAIDLTLINLKTGKELKMPTEFDEFSEKAHSKYADLPEDVLKNRTFLFQIMAHFGFTHYESEWWHFDYNGWEDFPLMDLSFEELALLKP